MQCAMCRFWSEMIAQANGNGFVEAMCLAQGGPKQGQYTRACDGCEGYKLDTWGRVDDPPDYGEKNRQLYREDEGDGALYAAGAEPAEPTP